MFVEATRDADTRPLDGGRHDEPHDESYDIVGSVPRNRVEVPVELSLDVVLERIEDRIEAIEDELAGCARGGRWFVRDTSRSR
jgi:hypothetical protein